jgi:hypothetical protein
MRLAMTLTLDGMLRALRGRVHIAAEEIGQAGQPDRDNEPRTVRPDPRSVEDRPR